MTIVHNCRTRPAAVWLGPSHAISDTGHNPWHSVHGASLLRSQFRHDVLV